jgi:hypothetical protein
VENKQLGLSVIPRARFAFLVSLNEVTFLEHDQPYITAKPTWLDGEKCSVVLKQESGRKNQIPKPAGVVLQPAATSSTDFPVENNLAIPFDCSKLSMHIRFSIAPGETIKDLAFVNLASHAEAFDLLNEPSLDSVSSSCKHEAIVSRAVFTRFAPMAM